MFDDSEDLMLEDFDLNGNDNEDLPHLVDGLAILNDDIKAQRHVEESTKLIEKNLELDVAEELKMGTFPIEAPQNVSTSQPNQMSIQNSKKEECLMNPSSWKVESSLEGISMEKRKGSENVFTIDLPNSFSASNKKKILNNKEIIAKVILYLDLFNEKKRTKEEMAGLRAKFSEMVDIPKKTMDDYIMYLKWAVRLQFPLKNYLKNGFGSIRKFVKYNLGEKKKVDAKKKFNQIEEDTSLTSLPRILENLIQ